MNADGDNQCFFFKMWQSYKIMVFICILQQNIGICKSNVSIGYYRKIVNFTFCSTFFYTATHVHLQHQFTFAPHTYIWSTHLHIQHLLTFSTHTYVRSIRLHLQHPLTFVAHTCICSIHLHSQPNVFLTQKLKYIP